MQIKLLAVFAFVLLGLVVLLIRISFITVTEGNTYARKVLSQQSYDSQTIPYRRGEIQDRNGVTLAKSDLYYNMILDCAIINSDSDYLEPTLTALEEVYGLDTDKLRTLILDEETASSRYQIIQKRMTRAETERLDAYVNEDFSDQNLSEEERGELLEERSNVQGVWFDAFYERSYPYDSLASNVVGFANDEDTGVVGIENYYNSMLNGTNGRIYGYLNSDLEYEKTTIEPEHGYTLVTTLDMNIQEIVEKYIAEFDEEYGTEDSDYKGAANVGVVVMDPNSGEILAMACNSSFDLNDPYDMSSLYSGAEIKAMDNTTYVDALNDMWSNFCVSESYEPGSVFKPITVASALECGAVHDGDAFYCGGNLLITDTVINCDNIYGHGDETLEYAIVNSCNVALMTISARMGISNFLYYQNVFNFGYQTGIDLPGETPGVVYDKSGMNEVELATCSFGQGFTVSMVQEITAFSTVINGGYYYQPHVVRQVLDSEGTEVKSIEPLVLKQPVSSSVSSLVRQYLTTAVQKGTGQKSQVPGYLTGGKTGTAEKIDLDPGSSTLGQRATGKYLVSFIGACPMDDPQVVIYVVVDEPNVDQQADSSYAQILFRKIATEVFPYMDLYPTEEVTQELLWKLGLTEDDVVKGGSRASATFQCFDSYGTLHNDAYVNTDGEIVDGDGNVIEGCYINDEGHVVDAYGNVIDVTIDIDTTTEEVAENPNIASPPNESAAASADDTTVWSGVTDEDLEDAGEDE